MSSNACRTSNNDLERNGLKTYDWGFSYWTVYHCWSHLGSGRAPHDPFLEGGGEECEEERVVRVLERDKWRESGPRFRSEVGVGGDDALHPLLLEFVFLSPRDLLPCVFCRRHFRSYTESAQYNIEPYIKGGKLPDFWYLIHNAVNQRLQKPIVSFDEVMPNYTQDLCQWEDHFWYWLLTIAFNFPADIQYPLPCNEHTPEIRRRLKTYILFFDMLKNVIPQTCALFEPWVLNYMTHPPTLWTFSSRLHLLQWLHQIQCLCQPTEQQTFLDMINELQPIRSTF